MDISVSHEQGRVPVSVVHVAGNIDSSTHDGFTDVMLKEIETGAKYLLIDLSGVDFMSSAGFRSLLQVFKQMRSLFEKTSDGELYQGINAGGYKSPYLKLLKPSKRVVETLKIAGLDMFIEIHDSLKDALASFQ